MTVTIHQGDCLAVMKKMPPNSVDCIVTSPPYWGLRDYGVNGQMGLEESLGDHLAVMVNVFQEARRILKPTGTCWINYGDCYASQPNGRKASDIIGDDRAFRDKPLSTVGPINRGKRIDRGTGRWNDGGNNPAGGVLKPKDLCMIPNRLAIALQEDGWWVRDEIIWAKPNPMPESARDRPGRAHEKIFFLTKHPHYFYDAAVVRVKRSSDEDANSFRGGSYTNGQTGKRKTTGNRRKETSDNARPPNSRPHKGLSDFEARNGRNYPDRSLRNYEPAPLQVWEMATKPFSQAHFATFPPELAERCIMAGCPASGIVFDPFGGAGTSALVAEKLGRDSILIELNPEYIKIAAKRIQSALPTAKVVRR